MTESERRPTAYTAHPAAELFPLMTGDQWAQFVKSIAEDGLEHPIVLWHGQILDGRNRYAACVETGREPRFVDRTHHISDPYLYVATVNLARRHLTHSQRSAIGAIIAQRLIEKSKKHRALNLPNVRAARASQTAGGAGSPTTLSIDNVGTTATGRAVDMAGGAVQVSPSSVARALELQRGAPDLFEQLQAGTVTVTAALMQMKERAKREEEGLPKLPAPTPMRKRRRPQTVAKSDPEMGPVLEVFTQIRRVILATNPHRAGELINGSEEIRIVAASRELGEWVSRLQVSRSDHVRLTEKGN